MPSVSFYARVAIGVVITVTAVSGCTLGPRQIHKGRLRYNEAIQRTFQEEMLLNLVRLKYRDMPEFLTVGGIAAQYNFNGSVAAGLTLPDGGTKVFGLDGAVARSERPTISYTPARGEDFQKGLLAPIDLASIQLLARTGWSWERILRTTVQYMNEVDNAISAGGPTPRMKPEFEEFRYLAQLLRQLQIQGGIELVNAEREGTAKKVPVSRSQLDGDFVINALKEGYNIKDLGDHLVLTRDEQYLAMVVHPQAKLSREMREVAGLLGLRIDYHSPAPAVYEVDAANEGRIQAAFKHASPSLRGPRDIQRLPDPGQEDTVLQGREDIIVSTRSLLEVMFFLSQGTQIPEQHIAEGLVTITSDHNGQPFNWAELTGDLICIRSAEHCPKNAAVSVHYNGYWFYIDDCDLNSKSTFQLLIELFGIEIRAGGGGGFLYTLSV